MKKGAANSKAVARKLKHYQVVLDAKLSERPLWLRHQVVDVIPFALETYGRLHQTGKDFMARMNEQFRMSGFEYLKPIRFSHYAYKNLSGILLSTVLARSNANLFKQLYNQARGVASFTSPSEMQDLTMAEQ